MVLEKTFYNTAYNLWLGSGYSEKSIRIFLLGFPFGFVRAKTRHSSYARTLIAQLIENDSVLSKRTIPLISHTINAHHIWNARIENKEKLGVYQEHSLKEFRHIDDQNFHETLRILEEHPLDELITYSNSKGAQFTNSIQHILFSYIQSFQSP